MQTMLMNHAQTIRVQVKVQKVIMLESKGVYEMHHALVWMALGRIFFIMMIIIEVRSRLLVCIIGMHHIYMSVGNTAAAE
jgi:hypothetical protein